MRRQRRSLRRKNQARKKRRSRDRRRESIDFCDAAIIVLALWQLLTLLGEFRHDSVNVLASRVSLMQLGSWTWFVVFFGAELGADGGADGGHR